MCHGLIPSIYVCSIMCHGLILSIYVYSIYVSGAHSFCICVCYICVMGSFLLYMCILYMCHGLIPSIYENPYESLSIYSECDAFRLQASHSKWDKFVTHI